MNIENRALSQVISLESNKNDSPLNGSELFGIGQIIEELPSLKGIISLEPKSGTVKIPNADGFETVTNKLFSGLPVFKCEYLPNDSNYPFITDSKFVFQLAEGRILVPRIPSLRLDLYLGLLAASCLPVETGEAFSEIVAFYNGSNNVDETITANINNAISYGVEKEIAFSLMPDFDEPSRLRGAFLLHGILNLLPEKTEKKSFSNLLKKLGFGIDSFGRIPREIEIVDKHYRVIKDRLSDPRIAIANL